MEKKTILAVLLSILVVIGYQLYVAKYYPAPVDSGVSTMAVNETHTSPEEKSLVSGVLAELTEGLEISSPPEKIITKETDRHIITLSSVGGSVAKIALKNGVYSASNKMCDLVDVRNSENAIFNIDGFDSSRASRTNFFVEEKADELIFTARISKNIELVKKYIFHNDSYIIELEIYIRNISDGQVKTSYTINTAADMSVDSKMDKGYIQAAAEIDNKIKRSKGAKGDGVFLKGNAKYAGLQNKYFSVVAKTDVPTEGLLVKRLADDNALSSIKVSEFAVLPRRTASHKFLLYAGPTDRKILSEYGLEGAANYGFLGGISDILLASLRFFHKIFKNWGIAVIFLSILVNLALFPLSRKSYQSMKKMQDLQPHMDKLREEHKDNPSKLNKEIMELYKKYNVNPMGGCLPLLLQIPVFIALYQALMKSLELRGSGFLWVKDLSMPDAVILPFSLPIIGNSINILPILMALAMIFQQKFSTSKGATQSEQQKQQQQMMVIMPVIFLFVMYSFPSGLVLYWLVNTLLTMFEQRAIMHG